MNTLTATEAPWTPDELVAALEAQGSRYHDLHPFHVRMNNGKLSREELQRLTRKLGRHQPINSRAVSSYL